MGGESVRVGVKVRVVALNAFSAELGGYVGD